MQLFVNLLRLWLISLIRGSDGLFCGRCKSGFEAVENIFVAKNSPVPGCVDHVNILCDSTDVCLLESILTKEQPDSWTIISGCQPKGKDFDKDFCVYKDLPQGEFYRCRCDSDHCNYQPTNILEDKFDTVIENEDEPDLFQETIPLDWIDQIKDQNGNDLSESLEEAERRKREVPQFNESIYLGSLQPNGFLDKLLSNNETRDLLQQIKQNHEDRQNSANPILVTKPVQEAETLRCAKCTVRTGKEELCSQDQSIPIDTNPASNSTFWCVNSIHRSSKGIDMNLRFGMQSEALLNVFKTPVLAESCTTTKLNDVDLEMCICRTNLCNNRLMADMKSKKSA